MSFSICHDPSSYTMPGSHRLTPSQDIGGWSNHLRSTWARQILWHHLPGGLHRTLGDEAWKHLVKTMELPESNWIQLNPTESSPILELHQFSGVITFWCRNLLESQTGPRCHQPRWSPRPPHPAPRRTSTCPGSPPMLAMDLQNRFTTRFAAGFSRCLDA